MKLKGEIVDRLREVLGGRTPTPKRIEKLLEEVEQARMLKEDGSVIITANSASAKSPDERRIDPDSLDQYLAPVVEIEPVVEAAAAVPPTEIELLRAQVKIMEQTLQEIRRPTTVADKDEAIMDGRLPVGLTVAPPLGVAPLRLGPREAKMVECKCGKCSDVRRFHWFCCVCKSGPHHFMQRYPHFTKNWYAPGGIHGVAHHTCSEQCRMHYLGWIGVTPGLNDSEPPPAQGDEAGLERPVVAHDSD